MRQKKEKKETPSLPGNTEKGPALPAHYAVNFRYLIVIIKILFFTMLFPKLSAGDGRPLWRRPFPTQETGFFPGLGKIFHNSSLD